MNSVLLTKFKSFSSDATLDKYAAVKVNDFFISTGSAFVSLIDDLGADCDVILNKFREIRLNVILPAEQEGNFLIHPVYCIAVHRSPLIKTSFDVDFQDIEFENSSQSNKLSPNILGLIVLFSKYKDYSNVEEAVHLICSKILPINNKMLGNPITVLSTPFQNLSFFNAYSQGIICNIFGNDQCLFLTDVKLSWGCEGSPVFSIYGDLIGMIMGIFTWNKGEWMGFSLALHLYPIMKSWFKSITKFSEISQKNFFYIGDRDVWSYGVVVVSTKHIWGSGIVVNKKKGIILTCSHVVNFSIETQDVLVEYKRKSYIATVIYATPRDLPFDIAVLKINTRNLDEVIEFKPPTNATEKGEAAYVIAYPLFSFRKNTIKGPSITYGHVSNVYPNTMIMTSCATNSGSSGGALVRPNGELLGIVTNNVTIPAENILIPHITIAVPSSVFLEPVKRFSITKDSKEFDCLKKLDQNVRDTWQLNLYNEFVKSKL